jgi:imidazole glycerol phosphate synthase subunit HisF
MTEEQFEQAMNTYQLDMEYTDYIMERANVGNGEILIRFMERGDFYEGFKESMVTE